MSRCVRLQQMEDNQSQSYDESRLQALRKEVAVSKSELLQLAYHDQRLLAKLEELNALGCDRIAHQQFYEAMVYLTEAENVLEYAAGCGRTIERTLIITTLHNQACVYQRIWELTRSADYIEAIIYNISSFLASEPHPAPTPAPHKLQTYLSNKLQLIAYNLQFCAVSSQIKNHENALASAQRALNLLKSYCEELHAYERGVGLGGSEMQGNLLLDLQNIRNFQNESMAETEKNIEKLLYKAKKSIVVFQKQLESTPSGLTRADLKELENFSLGQLMQVSPVQLRKMQERLDLPNELSLLRKIHKAIYISIAHFTMATELRLMANDKHGIDSAFRRLSKEFKESEVHHLVAVITVALYVPCYTKYFEHILNSFKNHYQIDLTQMSDLSLSQDGDDLIHLQIQSVSQRDSDHNHMHRSAEEIHNQPSSCQPPNDPDSLTTKQRMAVSFQKEKPANRTVQELNSFGSGSSSQNEHLKKLNRTARETLSKTGKKKEKSRKKVSEHTSREKKILVLEKVTSKSKSKSKVEGKDEEKKKEGRRGKSRRSLGEENEEKERVVHYFQYDNYSKKVVKKKVKMGKEPGEYELTKKIAAKPKEKKSPETLITTHLKKLNLISQSTKDLLASDSATRIFKKCKSPDLNSSRSQKLALRRHP